MARDAPNQERKRRSATPWLIAAVVAVLLVGFVMYGVDTITLMLRGGASPDKTIYVETDAQGLASLDAVLNSFAKDQRLFVSRADFGPEFGQPRELWRPGISIMVMNEFGCRTLTDADVPMSATLFGISITRRSFLGSRDYSKRLVRELQNKIAQSGTVRELPKRSECPPPLV